MSVASESPSSHSHRPANTQPFPKSDSSPTTSNTSTSSTWPSFSAASQHSSSLVDAVPSLNSSTNSNGPAEKRIRTLGESWISSSLALPSLDDPKMGIRRARSPSAPALPTHAHPTPQRAYDHTLSRQLASLDVDPLISYPIEQYHARPYPEENIFKQGDSHTRNDQSNTLRRLATTREASLGLMHHASVPNFGSRRAYLNGIKEEENDMQGEKRELSKSLSGLPRGKNGKFVTGFLTSPKTVPHWTSITDL